MRIPALMLRLSRVGLGGAPVTPPCGCRAGEVAMPSGRVAGEAGIGKTRLVEELAGRANARGAMVLWGRCWEGAGAPAFWPWVQVIRGYVQVQAEDLASLRHDLGGGAADIAQLVPAVHDR